VLIPDRVSLTMREVGLALVDVPGECCQMVRVGVFKAADA
jgi:hypothetical protein